VPPAATLGPENAGTSAEVAVDERKEANPFLLAHKHYISVGETATLVLGEARLLPAMRN
jgi:hypothetical protein